MKNRVQGNYRLSFTGYTGFESRAHSQTKNYQISAIDYSEITVFRIDEVDNRAGNREKTRASPQRREVAENSGNTEPYQQYPDAEADWGIACNSLSILKIILMLLKDLQANAASGLAG
ncbi:MAG: hypothetical protein IPJ30_26850 [Acidobacteria bacterium]|nr:hypothetical protein [Acidobacteriota bacterium]